MLLTFKYAECNAYFRMKIKHGIKSLPKLSKIKCDEELINRNEIRELSDIRLT